MRFDPRSAASGPSVPQVPNRPARLGAGVRSHRRVHRMRPDVRFARHHRVALRAV